MSKPRQHVLLLPIAPFGHLIPLLELGKQIAKHHDVTCAVSEKTFEEMQKRQFISPDDYSLVSIPDRFVPFGSANLGSTEHFQTAMAAIKRGLSQLLDTVPTASQPDMVNTFGITKPVDVVIGDNTLAQSLVTCHERNIPYYLFSSMAAATTLNCVFLNESHPILLDGNKSDMFTEMPATGQPNRPQPVPQHYKEIMQFIVKTVNLTHGVIINSVQEIEEDVARQIRQASAMKEVPLYFVGPLMPSVKIDSAGNSEQETLIRTWLDLRHASVVYVSFGSLTVPAPKQIMEIGNALLQSRRPFIWSLPEAYHQYLPKDIRDEILKQSTAIDRKFLILTWAPQKLILQHHAVAVFVSHCGWNSTLESMSFGVPIVAWPMVGDQKRNAEMLVKHLMAVMMEGTGTVPKRLVPADEIEAAIQSVIRDEDGEHTTGSLYHKAAQHWKRLLESSRAPGGSSDSAFRALMKFKFLSASQ